MGANLESFYSILTADRNRFCYTLLILFIHFSIGISVSIQPNCLVDLSKIYNVNISDITYLNIGLGVGYIVGALSGFFYRWLNRQLVLSALIALVSFSNGFLPHYGNLHVAVFFMFLFGLGFGGWNGSQTSWMVEMWPGYPTIALQSTELLYGVGGIIGPLLAAPFVFGEKTVNNQNKPITISDRIDSLTVPFAINGTFMLTVPVALLVLYFVFPYRNSQRNTNVSEEYEQKNGEIPNRIAKLALGALCLGSYVTAESSYTSYASTMYQKIAIELDAKEAAFMASILLTFFTLGRCVTALMGNLVSPDKILLSHFLLTIVSMFALFVGQHSKTVLYIGSAFLGYGFSAMTATIMAFSQRHLQLTDRVCSLYAFTAGCFVLTSPLILTQTFEQYPHIIFLLEACFLSTSFALFITIKLWIMFDNKKEN